LYRYITIHDIRNLHARINKTFVKKLGVSPEPRYLYLEFAVRSLSGTLSRERNVEK